MDIDGARYTIEEVTDAESWHISGLEACLKSTFPDYEPYIRTILNDPRREADGLRPQIFAAVSQGKVVAFLQMAYRRWHGGLIAWVDVLGVLCPYRRLGIASALVQRAISATRTTASASGLPAAGVTALIDPDNGPIVRLNQKLGGQIRADLRYCIGDDPDADSDVVVWYPLRDDYSRVSTKALAWQLWQFGGSPEGEFAERYGPPDEIE